MPENEAAAKEAGYNEDQIAAYKASHGSSRVIAAIDGSRLSAKVRVSASIFCCAQKAYVFSAMLAPAMRPVCHDAVGLTNPFFPHFPPLDL